MLRRALMWLNLYGREAVRHMLKNGLKTQKMHFLPVLGLMSESLTAIYRTRAIITRGLYFFYPIFHCGLYFRAVYTAERFELQGNFCKEI